MRVVDLRPRLLRRLLGRWERQGAPSSAAGRALVRAAAWPVDRIIARRAGLRPPPPAGTMVVSVGNLALGGTGKTPVVAGLAGALAARGRSGAVLTRGYGSSLAGPLVVHPDTHGAGDEARLLAGLLAGADWRVIQARRRAEALEAAVADGGGPDVVLLEDGHQTAGVGRHLDVLILDRWRKRNDGTLAPATGAVFPWGPWRESARGAERAAIWLVEGEEPPGAPEGGTVCGFVREFGWEDGAPAGGRVALLSGIARPGGFEAATAARLERPPVLALRCADHVDYDEAMCRRIEQLLDRNRIDALAVTAKDRVKLPAGWPAGIPVHTLRLSIRWTGTTALPDLVGERLDAVLRGVAR